jgi:hypothetical protein
MTPPEQSGATSARLRIEGLDAVPGPDQAGITATIGALFAAFQQRDAGPLTGIYTDNADWVNAFGSVKKGSAEIIAYPRGLFADQDFNDGQLAAPPASVLRPVTESVVIISTTSRSPAGTRRRRHRPARQPLGAHPAERAQRAVADHLRDVRRRPPGPQLHQPLMNPEGTDFFAASRLGRARGRRR